MIEIEAITKNYGPARALDGFQLRVESGALFGLVGPNGAGKTTLIKILSTLLPPDQGEARVCGHSVRRDPRAVRNLIGYMPDIPGLYHDMRVAEYLAFFADAFHLKGAQKREAVERALEHARLGERRDAYVEQLSLGMKQRLVVAKTLLHDPKVLLLDEPATGLDPLARIELREQLRALNRQGITILVSSHILADLEDICSSIAWIGNGKNATDAEGRTVTPLREAGSPMLTCEIEVLGSVPAAVEAVAKFVGARVMETEGARVFAQVGGVAQAAALLTHLTGAGISVVRFDPRGPGLEERYRRAFGERKP